MNMNIPTLTAEQAELFWSNRNLTKYLVNRLVGGRSLALPDDQIEELRDQADNGFMRGIAGFRGTPEDTKAVIQYAIFCSKRAIARRANQFMKTANAGPRRLNAILGETGEGSIEDFVSVSVSRKGARDAEDLIAELTELQRELVCAKFGIGRDAAEPEEVAESLGLTACEAVTTYRRGIKRLREMAAQGKFD